MNLPGLQAHRFRALPGNRAGLTLIELLIATSLVAVAAVVVAQAFSAGFKVWARASQLGGYYADAVITLETLQQDVRNTLASRQAVFRGEKAWLELPSQITDTRLDQNGDQPGLIRYEFDHAGQRLDRVVTALDFSHDGTVARETVARGVESLAFQYAENGGGALVWTPAWLGHTNNPAAVKVMWRGQQGDETFEFERTIWLPCK